MAFETRRPGILLYGAPRSGKSSIARVVFGKMPPNETLFLEQSEVPKAYTVATNPYFQYTVWDWPGSLDWAGPAAADPSLSTNLTRFLAAAGAAGGSASGSGAGPRAGSFTGPSSIPMPGRLASGSGSGSAALGTSLGASGSGGTSGLMMTATSGSLGGTKYGSANLRGGVGPGGAGGGAPVSTSGARGGASGSGLGSDLPSLLGVVRALGFADPQDDDGAVDADAADAAVAAATAASGFPGPAGGVGFARAVNEAWRAAGWPELGAPPAFYDISEAAAEQGATPPARITTREVDVLSTLGAVVLVIDAAADPCGPAAMASVRRLGAALLSLQRRRAAAAAAAAAAGAGGASIPPLPTLEVFLHKVDSEGAGLAGGHAPVGGGPGGGAAAGSAAEVRAELIRDVGSAVMQELADLGLAVAGGGSSGGGGGGGGGGGLTAGRGVGMARGGASAAAAAAAAAASASPLQVTFHVTSIHDHTVYESFSRVVQRVCPGPALMPACENLINALQASIAAEKIFLFDVLNKLYFATDSNPVQDTMYELCCDLVDVVVDVSCIYDPAVNGTLAAGGASAGGGASGDSLRSALVPGSSSGGFEAPPDAGRCSTSLIRLSNGTSFYLREVAPYLVVVALLKDPAGADAEAGEAAPAAANLLDAPLLEVAGGRAAASASATAASGPVFAPGTLPRCGLSLHRRALVDFNVSAFAAGLAKVCTQARPEPAEAAAKTAAAASAAAVKLASGGLATAPSSTSSAVLSGRPPIPVLASGSLNYSK